MIFATPSLSRTVQRDLDELDRLRARLGDSAGVAGPWLGALRRDARAHTIASSVSIEGFTVPIAEAAKIIASRSAPDPEATDPAAVACYARAMDHVGTMAVDPHFRWCDRVILDLHFDACLFQRDHSPGLWRTTPISVTDQRGTGLAFTGPDADDVPGLVGEVVDGLETGGVDVHVAVRAAMAHLNLISIHPFRDGNGRISRIVQSLVLARDGLLAPEFNSIEEHLGRETTSYYEVLRKVQGGSYQPARDATPWIRFCVAAHIEQATLSLDQMAESARRWNALESIADRRGWPDRLVIAMEQALHGGIERAGYAEEADVSAATATSDIRRLLDADLIVRRGRTRSVRYPASERLRREVSGL
jgi:Fic family protein